MSPSIVKEHIKCLCSEKRFKNDILPRLLSEEFRQEVILLMHAWPGTLVGQGLFIASSMS